MKNETIMDAIGMMDEEFLSDSLEYTQPRKKMFGGRALRNLLAAALAVALMGIVVLANTVPEPQEPEWEPYADADTMLDVMFGTQRYTPDEGMVKIQYKMIGKLEDNTAKYEEVKVPILSSASREPVSEELAALVEPYIIPVGETVVDPTGTITLEVMAYYYEPKSQCGAVWLQLTDPTGEFCGYVPEDPGVVQTPGEEVEVPKGIEIYLETYYRDWGKSQANGWPSGLRFVESLSNNTTWTFVLYFFCDNYDTVDLDIGFRTEPMVDHRPYRIDIDLEKIPTMDTITLGNAGNKKLVTISPVGMHIGEEIVPYSTPIYEVVLYFEDGSSYVVVDDVERPSFLTEKDVCTHGYTRRANNWFAFANIIDISDIYYVRINGRHYFEINW